MYFLEILTMLLFGALVGAAPQAGIPNVDVHVRWSLESAPNPICSLYPNLLTGTTNGTIFVVPIPMTTARSLIPAKWSILSTAIRELYPGFPSSSYPLIVHTAQDHDMKMYGQVVVPDFQSIRILFPFVDYLGDGYTSFTYSKYILVTSTQTSSQGALKGYGNIPIPVKFTLDHEAYKSSSPCTAGRCATQIGAVTTKGDLAGSFATQEYDGAGAIPIEFLANITSQFGFSDLEVCHNQRTFFNTNISSTAQSVTGSFTLPAPYVFPNKSLNMAGIQGMHVDFAWIENWNISCQVTQGYNPTH